MKDHIKPTLRKKPDQIVLQVGTNDLVSDRAPDLIAKLIVDVACSMKTENHDVTAYNIIARADHFKGRANEVNDYLSKLRMERNLYLIDHSKTLETQHLNGSKLNLSRRGAPILQNTLCKFLSKIFHWCFEENNVEIATVSSTAPQSDEECSKSKASQTANTENTKMDLKALRLKNANKLIIDYLNINSLRNKFEFLTSLIKDNIDILMISETKPDQTFFPRNKFVKQEKVATLLLF